MIRPSKTCKLCGSEGPFYATSGRTCKECKKTASKAAPSYRVIQNGRNTHPANYLLRNAVRDGRVTKWPVCAVPECSEKPEAHHADYDNPLGVTWLCKQHHKECHDSIV